MEAREARQALPGTIKVRITENYLGAVTLTPIDADVAALVGATNEYDGAHDVYISDSQDIAQFLNDFPAARWYCGAEYAKFWGGVKVGRGNGRWCNVNDGAIFEIDTWTFRHMVGGQSD